MQLSGGYFGIDTGGATFNFPTGLLQWTGGAFFGNTLTNSGVITMSGSADKGLSGTLNNNGTIIQAGTGNLVVSGYATINNNGVLDFQGDAQINGSGTLYNFGMLSKSAGTGVSAIGPPDPISGNSYFNFANNGGTIDVQTGTIDLAVGGGYSDCTGGVFNASAGAVLEITGTLYLYGSYTGAGGGEVDLAGGNLVPIDTGNASDNTTFNFPEGFFHWSGGQVDGGEVTTALTNLGFMTLDGAGMKSIYRNTIINQGTILDAGPGDFILNGIGDFGGSTFDNQFGAVFDIQGDSNIVQYQANAGTFSNEGTLEKTGGSGTSQIAEFFNSSPSGLIDVESGQLNLSNGGTLTGASFNIASGRHCRVFRKRPLQPDRHLFWHRSRHDRFQRLPGRRRRFGSDDSELCPRLLQ